MEPVPGWAKTLAIVVAIPTVTGMVLVILAGVFSFESVSAEIRRSTTFEVGSAPRLHVDLQFGTLVIEAGQAGRIVIDDRRTASTLTRAGAAAAAGRITLATSHLGDTVTVRQQGPLFDSQPGNRHVTIAIRVPVDTDVDVSNLGDVQIDGIDGAVALTSSGTVELRDVTLRGTSTISAALGALTLTNVTVAGHTTLSKRIGDVRFDGQLTPGGSALDIDNGAGSVTIRLPLPTDARASVSAQTTDFHSDAGWLFTPDQAVNPHHWTADLGPNPAGRVTVSGGLGSVDFGIRSTA